MLVEPGAPADDANGRAGSLSQLRELPVPHDAAILVGPEGGWSESDHEMAHASRWTSVTLGSRILRAETAAIVAVTLLQNRLGELG